MGTASLINIHASGSVKQGEVLFACDFGDNSVWTYALVDFNGTKVSFAKHSSTNAWGPLTQEMITGSGWLDMPAIKDYIKQIQVYALNQVASVGKVYAIDTNKEIGIYTDGKGNISNVPFTEKSTEDTLKELFGGSSKGGSETGSGSDTTTPFYKKPVNWLIAGVVAIAVYFGYKALKSNDED
ncbi:hypothetical protein [Flectobacillus rivi]|uniref:PepSY domain-containing protein n=1 Tax=Flectobacillus rivi TaxID=2984209 RepID=A0ABT6Z1G1_9BACT|nr:hypothetical protein [Flectobacillus rivi]MDI9874981.1 hypothetical protein [Flectobacillus rivi]